MQHLEECLENSENAVNLWQKNCGWGGSKATSTSWLWDIALGAGGQWLLSLARWKKESWKVNPSVSNQILDSWWFLILDFWVVNVPYFAHVFLRQAGASPPPDYLSSTLKDTHQKLHLPLKTRRFQTKCSTCHSKKCAKKGAKWANEQSKKNGKM